MQAYLPFRSRIFQRKAGGRNKPITVAGIRINEGKQFDALPVAQQSTHAVLPCNGHNEQGYSEDELVNNFFLQLNRVTQ